MLIFLVPALAEGSNNLSPSNNASTFTSAMQSNVSPHVNIYSSLRGSPYLLDVPVNSSDISVYPIWHINMYGIGAFSFSVNGHVVESGESVGSFNLTYTWIGQYANATLKFDGTYTFHDIISQQLSNHQIQSVEVVSSCQGQAQYFTVSNGVSGAIMYPHWTVTLESTTNTTYSLFVNTQQINSGSFVGTKTIFLNVTGGTVSVVVGVGNHVYKFPNELVSSVPISKYYGPKPPSLAYTLSEYEYGIARAFVASLFAVFVALLTGRKYVLEKEKRSVVRI